MIRTAGTTLHHIFRNNYGWNYIEVNKESFSPDDLKKLMRFNRRLKAFGGHFVRSTIGLDSVCPDLKYITFLRDPAARFISHYNHGRNRGHHGMSIDERVNLLSEADYQTKYLLGAQDTKERDFDPTAEDLEKAKGILAGDYAFVGIAERFEESLLLMKDILGMTDFDIRFERMHVTQKKWIDKDEISADLLNDIKNRNRMDYRLYEFAREELYEKQKKNYPGDLEKDVRILKEKNKNYRFKRSKLFRYRIVKYLVYKPIFKLTS